MTINNWSELCKMCGVDENTELTSEKKNALIEFLSKYNFVIKSCSDSRFKWNAVVEGTYYKVSGFGNSFEEASLNMLVMLYPQLLEAEQQAIESIIRSETPDLIFSFSIN